MHWIIVLFIGLVGLTQTSEAKACSCMKTSPAEGLSASYAVFTGKVTGVETNEDTKFGGLTIHLEVNKVWKGDVGEEVDVHTAANSAACGYSFAKGKTYLVYATRDEADPMRVSLCSRTALERDAKEDLDFLGDPKKTFDDTSAQKKSKHGQANLKDNCSAAPGPVRRTGLGWLALVLAGVALAFRRFD